MKLIIDNEQLYEILKEFHVVTGLKVSFIEDFDRPVMGVPSNNCALCAKKQLDDNNFYLRCKECDKNAMAMAKTCGDNVYIYECHYHLHEAVAPVKIDGVIVGYFVLGQMLVDRNKFLKFNNPTYEELELLNQLASPTLEMLHSASKMLCWMAKFCILNKNINYIYKESFANISEYINKNYMQDISVDSLCNSFHYSRSSLYALFKEESNMGITDYINNVRLEKSKVLLQEHKVSQVAQMIGIPDSNYFSRLFKQKFDCSPAFYIKKFLKQ